VRKIHTSQPPGMTERQKVLVLARLSGTYAALQLGRRETLSDVVKALGRLVAAYLGNVRRTLFG
jgi:hypothetical protein